LGDSGGVSGSISSSSGLEPRPWPHASCPSRRLRLGVHGSAWLRDPGCGWARCRRAAAGSPSRGIGPLVQLLGGLLGRESPHPGLRQAPLPVAPAAECLRGELPGPGSPRPAGHGPRYQKTSNQAQTESQNHRITE